MEKYSIKPTKIELCDINRTKFQANDSHNTFQSHADSKYNPSLLVKGKLVKWGNANKQYNGAEAWIQLKNIALSMKIFISYNSVHTTQYKRR